MQLAEATRRRLVVVLARAAELGWLGPGPVDKHIDHGLAIAAVVADLGTRCPQNPQAVLDLGSGGGAPGLIVGACVHPRPVTLLEVAVRRVAFLRTAAAELADVATLDVAEGRAEELARRPELDGHYGIVVARSFGRPAVTAECATRFLADGGWLVVSEPPDPDEGEAQASGGGRRWDLAGLTRLGFAAPEICDPPRPRVARLQKVGPTDERYPRRVGVPAKRPLW